MVHPKRLDEPRSMGGQTLRPSHATVERYNLDSRAISSKFLVSNFAAYGALSLEGGKPKSRRRPIAGNHERRYRATKQIRPTERKIS